MQTLTIEIDERKKRESVIQVSSEILTADFFAKVAEMKNVKVSESSKPRKKSVAKKASTTNQPLFIDGKLVIKIDEGKRNQMVKEALNDDFMAKLAAMRNGG